MLRLDNFHITGDRREFDFATCKEFAVPDQPLNLIGFKQTGYSACQLPHNTGTAFLHRRDIHRHIACLDPVLLELVLSPMKKLRRLKQRFGRNTACIQAGSTEGVLAIPIFPFVDTCRRQPVLRRSYSGNIPGRASANNHNIKTSAHCFANFEFANSIRGPWSDLQQQATRILQLIFDCHEKLYRILTVDDPVIIGYCQVHHWACYDFSINN